MAGHYFPPFFAHLAITAFLAISERCSGVSFFIRALVALRPRATAAGFLRFLATVSTPTLSLYSAVSICKRILWPERNSVSALQTEPPSGGIPDRFPRSRLQHGVEMLVRQPVNQLLDLFVAQIIGQERPHCRHWLGGAFGLGSRSRLDQRASFSWRAIRLRSSLGTFFQRCLARSDADRLFFLFFIKLKYIFSINLATPLGSVRMSSVRTD